MCGIAKYTFHISAFSLAAVKGKKGEDKKSKRGRTVTAPRLEKNIWNLASTARQVTHWRVIPESKEEEYLVNHQLSDEGSRMKIKTRTKTWSRTKAAMKKKVARLRLNPKRNNELLIINS